MIYKIMAYTTSAASLVLGLRFIYFAPSQLEEWGIEPTEGPLIVCRRYGALYLGLSVMFFLGRNAPPSDLRSAVCIGIGTALSLLSLIGSLDLAGGRVSNGILRPIVVEGLMAAGFVWAWYDGR